MPARIISTICRSAVRALVSLYYPRMDFSGRERLPVTGPLLIAANHANSLIDPVVLGIAARRPVHFLAKAPLFDIPLFGSVLQALGMIPAYRACDDGSQMQKNIESLAEAARLLVTGEAIGIFPEGKSHDLHHVEQVRTGAARIARQAMDAGGREIKIVPVGINYERKDRFGSAIWVRVGEAIDVNAWMDRSVEKEPKQAVRALTRELEARLQELVVHLDEPRWEPFLAEIQILRPAPAPISGQPFPRLRQRKRIADAMNHFLAHHRTRADTIAAKIDRHRSRLSAAGLAMDSSLLTADGSKLQFFGKLLLLTVGFPIAVAGMLHHLVPFLVTRLIATQIQAPGRSTVALSRLLIGLPIYAIWYGFVWWFMSGHFPRSTVIMWLIAMPLAGIIALAYWPSAQQIVKGMWRQLRWMSRRSELQSLRLEHEELSKDLSTMAAEYEQIHPPDEHASP